MEITKIHVKNFKSLVNVSASGFSSMNFIHGHNNSGKSNFIKFVELIFSGKSYMAPENYQDEMGVNRTRFKIVENTPFWRGIIYDSPFLFTNNKRTENIYFEVQLIVKNSEFPHFSELNSAGYLYTDRDETPIIFKGEIKSLDANTSEIFLSEVKLKNIVIYSNTAGVPKYFELPSNSALADNEEIFAEVMYYFNNIVMLIESERFFGKEKISEEVVENFSTTNFKNWLYDLSLDADKFEKFSTLLSFLNNFNITSKVGVSLNDNLSSFPFRNTKLSFSKFKEEIEVMLENPIGRFPLKNYGTGIQQLLYILSRLFNTTAKIILIEELELNLSPEYQELMINNLKGFLDSNKINQVFFTSHSDYLHRGDYKVYEVSIDNAGKSKVDTSSYSALDAMRRNLREAANGTRQER